MTTTQNMLSSSCPSDYLLKNLTGKWKSCIFRYATQGPVRFGQLMKILPKSSKQSITNALRELEESEILQRKVVQLKPLHVEYYLTEKGEAFIPVFKSLEELKLVPAAM